MVSLTPIQMLVRGIYLSKLSIFVAIGLGGIGCDNDPEASIQANPLIIDIGECLGRSDAIPATPSSCRWHIERQLETNMPAASAYQGCFVTRTEDSIVSNASPLKWSQGQAVLSDPPQLTLADGTSLSAAVFLFTSDVTASECERLNPTSQCDASQGCLIRLGPTTAVPTRAGLTVNFRDPSNSRCITNVSANMENVLTEVCDRIDNDCDAEVDEGLDCIEIAPECDSSEPNRESMQLGRPCNVTIDGCLRDGLFVCDEGGQVICDTRTIAPRVETCNGTDDDCDGNIDEGLDCSAGCSGDADCENETDLPYCENGVCAACRSFDNVGCTSAQPFCIAGVCAECRPGSNEGCNEATRARCSLDTLQCQGCTANRDCEDEQLSVCDSSTGECRGCSDDNECPDGICNEGRCVLCEPGGVRGCNDPLKAFCSRTGLSCEGCTNDEQCQAEFPDRRVCIVELGRCDVCDQRDRFAGCDLNAAPICDPNYTGPGAPCRPCNPEASGECRTGQVCVDGRCRGCNPARPDTWADSCGEESATPICDRESRDCVGCRSNDDCALVDAEIPVGTPNREALLRPFCDQASGRCRQCQNLTDGCDPASATPICSAGRCGECASDEECAGHAGYNFCILDDDDPRVGRCVRCVDLQEGDNERFAPGCNLTEPRCNERSDSCQPCDKSGFFPCLAPYPFCQSDGRCLRCEPGESAGCDLTSNAPICGNDGECRACNENDTCAGNRRCIGGRCEICDPRDNAGCDQPDEPICDAAAGRCRGCNQGECPAGLICNDGRCSGCSLETNQNCSSETPLCRQGANGTLSCGPCTDDVPCQRFEASGQSVCVAGQCEQCDPETNRGCSGETPTCDRDTLTCVGCEPDSCNGVCVAGVCRTCDPATNQGCDQNNWAARICAPEFQCGPCARSIDCLPSEQFLNQRQICERSELGNGNIDYRCVRCASNQQCASTDFGDRTLNFCINGKCRLCSNSVADTGIDDGCNADTPTCTSTQNECIRCSDDDDCSHQNGQQRHCEQQSGQCRLCINTAEPRDEVDVGCTAERPRCLGNGTRCAREDD